MDVEVEVGVEDVVVDFGEYGDGGGDIEVSVGAKTDRGFSVSISASLQLSLLSAPEMLSFLESSSDML